MTFKSVYIITFSVLLLSIQSVFGAVIPEKAIISDEIPDIAFDDGYVDAALSMDAMGFDLASFIILSNGEDDRVYPGETVSFDITVLNQGTIDAANIEVSLMIPVGLTSVIPNFGTITFAGPIAAGTSSLQTIDFLVDSNLNNSSELIIVAEISSAEDEFGANPVDVDSTPDADFTNDPGGVVDGPTDNTINNENGDEDDSDPENVFVEIFDLALRKTLAVGEDDRVYPEETISFEIEVFNQGSVPAFNISISDFVPAGLTVVGSPIINILGPLYPGSSETRTIQFTVDAANNTSQINNIAEITSYEDDLGNSPSDIDSTPDADPNNDPNVNDEINNGGGDEDDADSEELDIEIFDLATNITLAPGVDDRAYPGETVSFKVTVFNQGSVSTESIMVALMIPSALTSLNGLANLGTINFNGQLHAGDIVTQILNFTVDPNLTAPEELTLIAEIVSATDDFGFIAPDNDSNPDADFTNDPGGVVDSPTDDAVNNENGDEDDSDPENVFVEIFDLALRKTLAAGEDNKVLPGENITFDVEVFNQGSVDAFNIVVQDYVPAGLSPVGPTTKTLNSPLFPGNSQVVSFTFTADAVGMTTTINNMVEIVDYEDDLGEQPDDIDSVADTNPSNDNVVDNDINSNGGDEDDHDVETVVLCIVTCPDDVVEDTTYPNGTDLIIESGTFISSTSVVDHGASVIYDGTDFVEMLPGFMTVNASVFEAIIEGCGGATSNVQSAEDK